MIYTKEDHMMYLLSGGETKFGKYLFIGPSPENPFTFDDAGVWIASIIDITGMRYKIPQISHMRRLLENRVIDITKRYGAYDGASFVCCEVGSDGYFEISTYETGEKINIVFIRFGVDLYL